MTNNKPKESGRAKSLDPLFDLRIRFAELLDSAPNSAKSMKNCLNEITRLGIEAAPQFLYRYRPNNDYVIDELETGRVRFSSAASFEDLNDCSLQLPMGEMLRESVQTGLVQAASSSDPNVANKTFEEACDALDLPLNIPAKDKKLTLSEMLETERKENGSLYNLAHRLSSPVSAYAPQLEAQLKQLKILCLTARSNNKHMWECYANNGCGLVFEYATADLHSIDGDLQALSLPVMYSETNIPAMMVFALIESGAINRSHPTIQLFEQVLLLKAVYTKDPKEYAAEEEWRLCASSRPGENGMNYVTRCCMPKAVILGSNMDEAMRSEIIRTAKSKGIEIREEPERLL